MKETTNFLDSILQSWHSFTLIINTERERERERERKRERDRERERERERKI